MPKEVTAVFVRDYFEFTVGVEGGGDYSVELLSGNQSEAGYEYESELKITATSDDGWHFASWKGDIVSTDNPVTIIVEQDMNVIAEFERNEYTLAIDVEGEGSVNEQLLSGTETEAGYLYESEVELEAVPENGWQFVEWQSDLSGTDNPSSIQMDMDRSVTAVFEPIEYTIDVTFDGEGTVSEQLLSGEPVGNGYMFGSVVELTVETQGDWNFVHWSGEFDGEDNPIEVTIEGDVNATAHTHESPFAGGDGSEIYPYQVQDVEQLQEIRNYANSNFLQTSNIDAVVTQSWNGGNGFIPIGDETINFSGVYDGNGFEINSLYINRSESHIGLFGYVKEGILENITLQNVDITGDLYVGGLVGWHESTIGGNSVILNSTVTGNITGTTAVGGLVGQNAFGAQIESSSAENRSYWRQ
ncbi:MAG: GLUG motif-containing protein [Gracilimonas sp.]|nr:GLUG motif-containing protein [Gracilimonas sp.]